MKVIVGLGNPGLRYAHTRHNMGFWVVDLLSQRWGIPLTKHKFGSKIGEGRFFTQQVMLVKPQTFMNRSGEAVGDLVRFYQLDLADLLVIYDDLDLAPGMLRVRAGGSSGGHRGVANIIDHLQASSFPRVRIGIGAPPEHLETADYVLQVIDAADTKILQEACQRAADAVEVWLKEDVFAAMNLYNRRQISGT
ncbi:MAG: aminoacyl-tRNA hydrolase [Firmicutes bacterium]|nr:aminoacyl-tRNA hydrolase [Bacillota bacterium]